MTNTEIAAASKIMLGTTQISAMYIGSQLMWHNETYWTFGNTLPAYI